MNTKPFLFRILYNNNTLQKITRFIILKLNFGIQKTAGDYVKNRQLVLRILIYFPILKEL